MTDGQLEIPDAARLKLVRCDYCRAEGYRHHERIPDCLHDLEQEWEVTRERHRPATCVNLYDPATAPIPF